MNKTVRLIADRRITLMGVLLTFFYTIGILYVEIDICCKPLISSRDKEIIIVLLVSYLLFLITIVICLPRWFAVIELNTDGILFKAPFKKTTYREYYNYGYIYCASYRHFIYPVKYVVISQVKLNDYQLTHINSVPQSDKTIKILLNKENKEKLQNILPKQYISRIK